MNINDDMYYDTLLSEQTAVFEENIQMSNELVSSFKKMIKSFEDLDDISSTGETINKLNNEIEKLKNTTSSLNKSISSSNNIMNTKPKEIDYKSDSALEKMNPRQQKKYFNSIMEQDEENTKYKSKASGVVGDNDKELDVSGNALTVSKLRFSNFQRDYENLKRTKEETKPDDTSTPNESDNPKTEPKKEKEQDEEKKKDDKLMKFGMFFAKSIGKSFMFSLKTVMSPITMTLKGMGGMLSGIWNSSLMGIAKTVAMIGGLVLAFDWVKVTLNSWKTQMVENYEKFMSENETWGSAMAQLVMLGEAIQKFLDPNFETKLLKNTEVGWIGIAERMGDALLTILGTGMDLIFDSLLFLINGALGGTTTREQWDAKRIKTRGDYTNDEINELNASNVIKSRAQRKEEALIGGAVELNYKNIDIPDEWTPENLSKVYETGLIKESVIKAVMADTGMDYKDAKEYVQGDDDLKVKYIEKMNELRNFMVKSNNGILKDFNTQAFFRGLGDNGFFGNSFGDVYTKEYTPHLNQVRGQIGDEDLINIKDDVIVNLNRNIADGKGKLNTNANLFNTTPQEVKNVSITDMEAKRQNNKLAEVDSGNLRLTNAIADLVAKLNEDSNSDQSNFAQINNIQQSNSYGTSEPTGNVRYFGNESIRHGSVRY